LPPNPKPQSPIPIPNPHYLMILTIFNFKLFIIQLYNANIYKKI